MGPGRWGKAVAGRCARVFAAVAILLCVSIAPGVAAGKRAKGVVLTIQGQIDGDGPREFTLADLEAMERQSFTTWTPWHDAPVTFEGVPLAALMKHIGARGQTVIAEALNKYYVEFRGFDFVRYKPIIAYKADGAYMGIRDKGPLFVIFPFDSDPELKSAKYYALSIWQLKWMTVQ